ncbi:MAG: hypothetical protein QCI00_04130 [Candidatus Thermoplasmatota archaeon]|nr:hypothetical protein [Candidatus Thermoplasmatota archaeon]
MTVLENMIGSYCKVLLVSQSSSKSLVESGFIKNIDNKGIVFLENEKGIIQIPFNQICAVKKIDVGTTFDL